ncbi:MAG: asparagine synthase (glutamine-hydrolyzing) [Elusimicrobia bacterium]|nr:asparagine synthase (glutamine-hydrolyzing) [Candidatus Obscuribacterium magneticum]
MCGLLGIFRTRGANGPIDQNLLIRMRDTMVHRGPDDAGVFVSPDNNIGLAHRRLSIIDLSSLASQPMFNEDGSLGIVFNGEIYNHAEIRPLLEKRGRRFKTDHSDTEVILKGYEEWGEDVLPRLRGMFAFAIWDKKKRNVWLARDRMGVKPLYYTDVNGMFLFASEIKAILEYPGVKRTCHERAFYDFLTFLVSPPPQTLFENIYKLPAGHTLTIDGNGQKTIKRYWHPFSGVTSLPDVKEEEWTEKIISTLRESIRYRMVSDVNFGVFLSGGIDSSTNVALMAELMDRPVETFSIGFKGADKFNELHFARKIVDRYKTNHHEIIMDEKDLISFLPKLVYHQDEPIVDPVCVPVYFVSKLAKDSGTTVCQVGEGSDELFCGYPSWGGVLKTLPWVKAYQGIPAGIRHGFWQLAAALAPVRWNDMRRLDLFRRVSKNEPYFWGGAEAYPETHKKRFLNKSLLKRLNGYSSVEVLETLKKDFVQDAPEGADDLHWMTYLDLRFRLPELLLMRVDKMSMATAVEARVPFLDQEFIRLVMGIPQTLKFKDKTLKYLLKEAVKPLLPHDIIHRPKQGFGVPVDDWFKEKLLVWSDKKIMDFAKRTPFFDPIVLQSFLNYTKGNMTWFLLNFVLWHEFWIEQKDLDLPI